MDRFHQHHGQHQQPHPYTPYSYPTYHPHHPYHHHHHHQQENGGSSTQGFYYPESQQFQVPAQPENHLSALSNTVSQSAPSCSGEPPAAVDHEGQSTLHEDVKPVAQLPKAKPNEDLEEAAIQSASKTVERGKYECSICSAVCVDRQGFADHLFGFHLGIARFYCRFCDRKFFYRPKVYEHIREAHSGTSGKDKSKKKKGVVPFVYQLEGEEREKLVNFLKSQGREAVFVSRTSKRGKNAGLSSTGLGADKTKSKLAFRCKLCNKQFTAQSYVDRHVKKGSCSRRKTATKVKEEPDEQSSSSSSMPFVPQQQQQQQQQPPPQTPQNFQQPQQHHHVGAPVNDNYVLLEL